MSPKRKRASKTTKNKQLSNYNEEVTKIFESRGYVKFASHGFNENNTFIIKQGRKSSHINAGSNASGVDWINTAHIILPTYASKCDIINEAKEKDSALDKLKKLFNTHSRKETYIYQPTSEDANKFNDLKFKKFKLYLKDKECIIEQAGEEDLLKNLIPNLKKFDPSTIIAAKEAYKSWEMPKQIIYYGAPGTGKSYKVNQQVNSRDLLKKEFSSYLQTDKDVSIAPKSADDYVSYCKIFEDKAKEGKTNESFFYYADPLSFWGWKEKYSNIWDFKYWGAALNWYIQFLKKRASTRIFRTTFHPDFDYSQFVGAYKPTKDRKNTDKITYEFVPQVFAKAYAAAWRLYLNGKQEKVYLIIEEINRGNCAQIFGDIFQLLDRDERGFSRYSINIDSDFAEWLRTDDKFGLKNDWNTYIINPYVADGKIALPPNLDILATMNTSDQSLFPMDSAFKRRFDWKYVPINYEHLEAHFAIEVGDKKYDWLDFLKKVNGNIDDVTKSEDKKLGEFFIKPKNGNTISFEDFRSKVLFYLWDSIYKDEEDNSKAKNVFHFDIEEGQNDKMTFQKLFDKENGNEKGIEYVNKIMTKLEVKEFSENDGKKSADDSTIKPKDSEEQGTTGIPEGETQPPTEAVANPDAAQASAEKTDTDTTEPENT
jgi:hypothetical protein